MEIKSATLKRADPKAREGRRGGGGRGGERGESTTHPLKQRSLEFRRAQTLGAAAMQRLAGAAGRRGEAKESPGHHDQAQHGQDEDGKQRAHVLRRRHGCAVAVAGRVGTPAPAVAAPRRAHNKRIDTACACASRRVASGPKAVRGASRDLVSGKAGPIRGSCAQRRLRCLLARAHAGGERRGTARGGREQW